jgi:benzoyl-CoA reductase/2-hydroxyglutaryl-CoA dehydratase subunit BcrC/BadD/HgdB
MDEDIADSYWILPTTCDWVNKFPEMAAWSGLNFTSKVHWIELPHLKDKAESRKRWLDEIFGMKKFLETTTGRIDRRALAKSIELYREAWRALNRLVTMRREGALANVWFTLITGAFFFDSVENWTASADRVAPSRDSRAEFERIRVFLAGSPIFFPNFKLPFLFEEAELAISADDLCSSERIFPGAVTYDDASEFGMISALSERYHQGCLCPTFIDNDRRINNILGRRQSADFNGVVFHVLKGCHPYDIESCGVEAALKERGLKFLRLETDYAGEDSSNLLTRLEAFRNALKAGRQ